MLNHDQFQAAIAAARQQFALIRKKYPELKAYLVLSLPRGQTRIDNSTGKILSEFPTIIMDGGVKTATQKAIEALESQTTLDAKAKRLKKCLEEKVDALCDKLKYDERCRVEIRFDDLNYALVSQLQADDLVDRSLTPQTMASIRIVLGTLAQFERPNTNHEHGGHCNEQ